MYNLTYRIRTGLKFSQQEVRDLIISVLIMALVVGWDDGATTFNTFTWTWNLSQMAMIVGLAMLVNITARKITGLAIGYEVEYKPWAFETKLFGTKIKVYGLLLSFLILFFSSGNIWFLITGGFITTVIPKYRIGTEFLGVNKNDLSYIAFVGLLSNLILALLFKAAMPINPILIEKAILINISLVIFSLLLIPDWDGLKIFFHSAPLYVSFFVTSLLAAVLILNQSAVNAMITLFILGFIGWVIAIRFIKNI